MKRLGLVITIGMVFALAQGATAQAKPTTFQFEIEKTSISRAANGDTLRLYGMGEFVLHPASAKSVTGSGKFTHRDDDGNLIGRGGWKAVQVLSYHSYGPATPEQIAAGVPAGAEGGNLLLKISLFVRGVRIHDGILRVVCLIGNPPKNQVESFRLKVLGTSLNFNEPLAGENIFFRG